ncbi:MAG: hypothetical protein RIQ79_94 [Verrucomicrobiota bacterium]
MKIRKALYLSLALSLAPFAVGPVFAGAGEIARAVAIVERMVELNKKFSTYNVTLATPEPIVGSGGSYLLPVNADGTLTPWAEKALNAQVGNIAGEQAGAAASRGLASAIPGGGLAGGFFKKKGKEMGAAAAMGGKEFIRNNSTLSFNTTDEYAVYLHAKLSGTPEYQKALTAAIALYPDLETGYDAAVTAAYNNAVALEKAKQAADAKAAADAAKAAAAMPVPAVAPAPAAAPAPAVPAAH